MRASLMLLAAVAVAQAPFDPDRPIRKQPGASAVWSKSVSRIDIGVTQSVAITGGLVTMVLPKGAPGGAQTVTPRPAYIAETKPPSHYVNAAHQTGVGPGIYVTEAGWVELHRVWREREARVRDLDRKTSAQEAELDVLRVRAAACRR